MGTFLKSKTRYLTQLALLSALAIALSALEGIFTPVLPPGARAGFSNIATMLAALEMGLPAALTITLFKALFALLMRGTVSFVMSLAGGMTSAVLLWLLFRFCQNRFGYFGISMLGALCHNLAQLAVSYWMFGFAIFAYAPILVFLAIPCGLATGALLRAALFLLSRRYQTYRKDFEKE